MKKENSFSFVFIIPIISLSLFLLGCDDGKKKQPSAFEQELAKQIAYENKIKQILTDDLCRRIIQNAINKETESQIDISDGVLTLSKEPYKSHTTFSGKGYFEGSIKGKKNNYSYQISLSSYDNNNLKDLTKWELNKLVIQTIESQEKVFFAGKGVWEVGDHLLIDGKKITLTFNNGTAQKFTTKSKLSKEQIMKLWDCRERPYANIINLYLPNQKSEYASYNDGVNGLFLFSPNKMYEVKEVSEGKYEFITIQ